MTFSFDVIEEKDNRIIARDLLTEELPAQGDVLRIKGYKLVKKNVLHPAYSKYDGVKYVCEVLFRGFEYDGLKTSEYSEVLNSSLDENRNPDRAKTDRYTVYVKVISEQTETNY